MKLRFALTALTCSSFYKELRSAPATNPNTNSNGFSQKFETGNFPEFPKVEDMFNIVDRYTAVVYDNMKHQANLYKNEISDMKSDLEEFKKGMNGEQKDVRKVLDGQSKVIEEQRVEIESLKGMLLGTASGLADSSDENTPKTSTSILDRISSMETTYSTKLSNQGKLLLNTVVNFKKLIRKERQEFQTKLSERDLTINQQAKQLSSFKTIFESFKNKFTSTVDKVASLEDEVDEIDDLTVAQGKSLVEQGGKIEVNLNSITGLKSVDVDYGKKLDTLEPLGRSWYLLELWKWAFELISRPFPQEIFRSVS